MRKDLKPTQKKCMQLQKDLEMAFLLNMHCFGDNPKPFCCCRKGLVNLSLWGSCSKSLVVGVSIAASTSHSEHVLEA